MDTFGDAEEDHFVCKRCGKERLFRRDTISHGTHAVLAVCTGGLWLICWISLVIGRYFFGWTCTVCKNQQRRPGKRKRD